MGMDYKIIGTRIQEKRKSLHLTQENLAEKLSVSVGYISQIERGITKVNLDMLSEIAVQLNCDICDFLSNASAAKGNYLDMDIQQAVESLNSKDKKILLEVAEVLKNNAK